MYHERLLSIEGIVMLMIAGMFDILGLLDFIPLVGNILAFAIDIPAVLIIGSWMLFFKSKRPHVPAAVSSRLTKITGKMGRIGKAGRWIVRILAPVGEMTPGIGILPLWTILVFMELTTD